MQYRVAFAREQSVHSDTGFAGNLFEASAFQLVRDKDLTLFLRQFVNCRYQFVLE